MTASAKPTVVGDTYPVDSKEYDSLSWVLLEDHPLRSYPTTYPPGLSNFLGRWYGTARRWWSERGLTLVCLFVMFLMVIQFLANLPYGVSYLLATDLTDQADLTQWPTEFIGRPSACISYGPEVHLDAIDRAVKAGCAGIKADVWVRNDELFVGNSSKPDSNNTFSNVYLEPLMAKLDARNPAVAASASLDRPDLAGLLDKDPAQPFILFLQPRSSISTAWPHLVSQISSLDRKGYLSYTDGAQIVPRPVSIVITGLSFSEVDFVRNLGHEGVNESIFFETVPTLDPTGSEKGHVDPADAQDPENDNSQLIPQLPPPIFSVRINFRDSIGSPRGGRFSWQQVERIRAQIHNAHQRGLQIRYDAITCLPRMLRRIAWRILVHEGADYIEVDWRQCEGRSWPSLFTIGSRDDTR
ncbi:Altered inheritance of mitochondria protein 6 [Aspergillus melleus]|uniref:Altered inheritance of mitochondria protein 6 n=1 Tax=Aspergillus melleus TaxID=138277 RepID=A0ACC3BBQ6_9EURO|nr:Altered inheritance of mitochondria protein 6 [Aspergillus melleus]